jgi:ATP-dependent DNA helicase RecG
VKILSECTTDPKSKREIVQMLGHSEVSGSVKKAIAELIRYDLLDYTIPEKPRSRLQKYRTTGKGFDLLKQRESRIE